jgi:glycolate oxidase FAD binding subunit
MRPATVAELAEAIRTAKGPLSVRGGASRSRPDPDAEILETGALAGIDLYEPAALTLVAKAGTPLDEVKSVLAGERQRLAFEPPDLRRLLRTEGRSTIGGVAATNASGPRRIQPGSACRDAMLGVQFVDGSGTPIRNGGRVMKNVTGYDLVKLMAGSRGRLGVLTEVSLRVQAQPDAEATLVASGLDEEAGLAALRSALTSPYDVSGAAHVSAGDLSRTLIRVEGMTGSVAYRVRELMARLGGDWSVFGDTESAAVWRDIRDVTPFAEADGSVWRLSVVPTDARAVPLALSAAGVPHRAIWDWGGGLLWLLCPPGQGGLIRGTLAGQGHATRLRGDEDSPAAEPDTPGVSAIASGLRAVFDPRGIFSSGG